MNIDVDSVQAIWYDMYSLVWMCGCVSVG